MKSTLIGLSILFYFILPGETIQIISVSQDTPKINAFKVLVAKCNVCHATKKKQDIFTIENMDSLALVINKQIFIKGKMPKGKKNKLSLDESQAIQEWLNTILNP